MSEAGAAKGRSPRRRAIAHAADAPTDQMRIPSTEAA
jgi:hypothetical protein